MLIEVYPKVMPMKRKGPEKKRKTISENFECFSRGSRCVALHRIRNVNVKSARTPLQVTIQKLLGIYKDHDFVSVINLCGRLLNYYPKTPIIWNLLGAAQYEMDDFKNALYAFEKVTQLAPEYPDGYNNLGNVFRIN